MSPRTRITTLNLGSQSIELAEFQTRSEGELTLCSYGTRELFGDSTRGIPRQAEVTTALRELMVELQIKPGIVNYSVAEELIFTRFVRLPAIEEEKLERIISFEAQQNVPFPIDEVVWDYQLVSGKTNDQTQVILAAIKADLLDEINSAVEATGLRTSIVDLATMALYNAFRHSYCGLNGCSLLIDIGARTTNLLFVESGKVFTRSVPIGGGSITSGIAKEFSESFAAAELRKKRDGSAGSENNGSGPLLTDLSRVEKIVRGTMTRLLGELMRSINHYCGQQQGKAPERVFLSGGGANTPGLHDFFREKLHLPTEFFDPLRTVSVPDSAIADKIAGSRHLLGEPVGLALRSVIDCPIKLNLRPASVVRRHDLEKRRPFLIGAALCFLLGFLAWGFYFARASEVLRRRTKNMEDKVVALKRIESQLNEVRRQTSVVDSLAIPLMEAINDRSFWIQIIEELNSRLPTEDIWVTELTATSKRVACLVSEPAQNRIEAPTFLPSSRAGATSAEPVIDGLLLRGLYLFNPNQQEIVVDYFRNLTGSPWFAIDQTNQANYIKPTTPNDTEWAFPYELRLDLRKPIKLR